MVDTTKVDTKVDEIKVTTVFMTATTARTVIVAGGESAAGERPFT